MDRRRRADTVMLSLVLAVAGCGTPPRTITGSEAIQRFDIPV